MGLSDQTGREGAVVCLGYFDGVHLGHQALLKAGRERAEALGLPLLAHTFDRAPQHKDMALTDLKERKRLLLRYGADGVFVSPFDDAMRRMSGEDFFRDILLRELGAKHLVCGHDHRFGYGGQCDIAALHRMCEESGTGLTVVPDVTVDGLRVSSTAIREALARGDTALAERMLGRPVISAVHME